MNDILVVDDEADIRDLVVDILEDEGYKCRSAKNSSETFTAVTQRVPSVIILDIWLQGSQLDGLGVLQILKQKYPSLPIIIISGHGNIETAVTAIKYGAYEYLEKPFKEDKLLRIIARAIETNNLRSENAQLREISISSDKLIGTSKIVSKLAEVILKTAAKNNNILITGEPGVGKTTIAKIIHTRSPRKNSPFITLRPSMLSKVEPEIFLFGKSPISGASLINVPILGLIEQAHGGILFIEEIASIPLKIQVKIAKIMNTGLLEREGEKNKIMLDIRFIVATNKDIDDLFARNLLHKDLYNLLKNNVIYIASLRERREDIKVLVKFFIKKFALNMQDMPVNIDDNALAILTDHDWPGNIRQLKNAVEASIINAIAKNRRIIDKDILPYDIKSNQKFLEIFSMVGVVDSPLKEAREIFEKQYIRYQLDKFNGNVSKTASFIGMERSAFHRKIKVLEVNGCIHKKEDVS